MLERSRSLSPFRRIGGSSTVAMRPAASGSMRLSTRSGCIAAIRQELRPDPLSCEPRRSCGDTPVGRIPSATSNRPNVDRHPLNRRTAFLMIGLGGGSLVKFCHRHLRNTRLTVVEVDPDVVALREWFHIPTDDDRLRVLLEDGADYVRRGDWAADILLIDAFDPGGVAPSLASADFYAYAFRCLRPNGLLVMNLAGERARYAGHLERLCKACPGSVLLVPVATDGNLLIFAFAERTHAWTFESLEATAEELQSEFALEFPRFLYRLRYEAEMRCLLHLK